MLIKEISIANIRGIREGKLSDLVQVNILVGRNNTGKSSVLEALALLSWACGATQTHLNPLQREMPRYLFERRVARSSVYTEELHFGLEKANKIQVVAAFEDTTAIRLVEYRTPESPRLEGGGKREHEWMGRAVLFDAALSKQFDTIEAQLWQRIKADRRDRTIRDAVADAYNLEIEHLSFVKYDGTYKLSIETRHRSVPVDSVGDGLRNALAVLSVAVMVSDSALMVEELETHQHPESLQKLLLALFKMAKRNSIQLFMSTHSLELISYALEAAEKEGLELKVYHCTLSQDGALTARGIPAPDAKLLTDMGHDLRMQHKFVRS